MQKVSSLKNYGKKGSIAVVVVAAGASVRMNGLDKIFSPINDIPLITHSLKVFNSCPNIDQIALVVNKYSLDKGRNIIKEYSLTNVTAICIGGTERRYSVSAGLNAIQPCDTVIVHDAARPIIDLTMIARGLLAAEDTGAAVAAVPTRDTHKIVSSENMVIETLDRRTLWQVQTPQIFDYHLLVSVHKQAKGDFTDDASMVESLGHPVKIFMGSYKNIKVTTPEDISIVESLIEQNNKNESAL
ncbi:2-C-methyl-D-erythritol 4-phosphate cytidylyltransferase [SAR202 cluster bacterium AC-409-J13_OGT_754m]|nr:2-C-methyl-D-erythritol 4-phosphate cytidylyltransferase [SAR202 cluster bacterium AC-409-J13_OGT_754m]